MYSIGLGNRPFAVNSKKFRKDLLLTGHDDG